MRILRYRDADFSDKLAGLNREAEAPEAVVSAVGEIVAAVRAEGDAAVLRFTAQFGGPSWGAGTQMRVDGPGEADPATRRAIVEARANVRAFAKRSLRKSWSGKNRQGAIVGERFDPFDRVGIYVPGGTAPLVSSAVMTVTLAEAAGVPEIVVATPAGRDGMVNGALLWALRACGATEVYGIGGAQAVAALAYGTETIRPVRKVFGPGNAYVVEAKRQVFGKVAVDLLPGPSEIMVLADRSADAAWIAADMLAQAEHGHGGSVVLVTDSAALLKAVEAEVDRQVPTLSRGAFLRETLEAATWLVQVKTMREGVRLANEFAPEHLSLVAENGAELAKEIRTAGAVFLGGWSPVAAGDFLAGPSHELPTGGAGKSFAGLTADQFQRRTSVVKMDRRSLEKSVPVIRRFSEVEGLDAHGRSAEIRFEAGGGKRAKRRG